MDQDIPFMNTGIPGPIRAHLSQISSSKQLSSTTFVSILGIDESQVFKLVAYNASNLGGCK